MADYNSTATSTIYVNGKPAEAELQKLKQRASDLRDAIASAAKAGDKASLKKLRSELNQTKREVKEVEGAMHAAEVVMKRLDKATPKELQATLRQLKKELNDMERGTDAWDKQVAKIKRVKAELDSVNDEMKEHQSLLSQVKDKINDWGMSVATAAAALTGLTMTARQAVEAFAEMDAEMANTRKFTGMSAEEVERLNEAFKSMDTRTSREGLNQLAQEAGRLGLQTQDDVLGFVKAADQLNVALDDLGEGATLTLSKLTDIFGDKQRLGVEQSLLSVGSVINELSQNCTASAPYLAQFAQRLAGVGAQARMTIPEIMGFAAVLDSQGQAVEMSATAVSQLITKLFQDPAKIAKATGLELQEFNRVLKEDTNQGLLMLLERLHELGGIDALAPVLKDMGTDGARASAVISALAGNIGMVKQQQEAANKAFQEGTSVTKEYNVQNNTVKAQLDKAKKGFREMTVELGQKLAPIMSHVITATSGFMRVLSGTISFVIKYRSQLTALAMLIAGVTLAVKAATAAKVIENAVDKAGNLLKAAGKVITLACSYAYNSLTGNLIRAAAAQRALNAAMTSSGWGAIVVAIGTAVTALSMYIQKTKDAEAEQKRLREEAKNATNSIKDVNAKIAQETSEVKRLKDAIDAENMGSDMRNSLIKQFNAQFGTYMSKLLSEKSTVQDVAAAYAEVVRNLRAKLLLEGKEADIKNEVAPRIGWEAQRLFEFGEFQKEGTNGWQYITPQYLKDFADKYAREHKGTFNAAGMEEAFREHIRTLQFGKRSTIGAENGGRDTPGNPAFRYINPTADSYFKDGKSTSYVGEYFKQYSARVAKQQQIERKWSVYQDEIDAAIALGYNMPTGGGTPSGGGGGGSSSSRGKGGSSSSKNTDKFAAEKAWREYQEALAKSSYAKREIDLEEFNAKMLGIERDYYQKQLAHKDLNELEKVTIQAQYDEVMRKMIEGNNKMTIEQAEAANKAALGEAAQRYVDGKSTYEQYTNEVETIETLHLVNMATIYARLAKEDSNYNAKKLEAEDKIRKKLIENLKKTQDEIEKKKKEHEDKLNKLKDTYFGLNDEEKQALYDETVAALDEVYKLELAKLGDNLEAKLKLEKKYAQAKKKIHDEIFKEDKEKNEEQMKNWEQWVEHWLDKIFGEGTWEQYGGFIKSAWSSLMSGYQSLTELVKAEEQAKLAAMTKKYDAELKAAEGNQQRINQINKRKAAEEKRIKDESNKRAMVMEIAQAIATNSLNALNAYGSVMKSVPYPLNMVLAPITAGLALSAGLIQIAAIRKQHQAQAQGYAEGGFTRPGGKHEPAGIVHAGEWVASQKLLASPVARPLIEALDYAQRTNTIGRLGAGGAAAAPVVMTESAELRAVIVRLNERLNEPFVTVNTVSGDHGIKRALDDYNKLQNNTLPKNKRT